MPDRRTFLKNGLLAAGASFVIPAIDTDTPPTPTVLGKKLRTITRSSAWKLVSQIKVNFTTWHCQGMVKIGKEFWISSVEVEKPAPGETFDWRKGKGHLFKIDENGNKLADIPVGEGTIYHPSGIDFDGKYIWVAAAEYRPDSQAIIYRFDPAAQQLEKMFAWQDHIGGVLRDPDANSLHAISWGSRRFYRWALDKAGSAKLPSGDAKASAVLNNSFYVDYQDNQYIGSGEVVYTGINAYKRPDGSRLVLGGLEVVNLATGLPVHQVPVELWSPVTGACMTQNPSYFELQGDVLRAYFMPDDNESTIFVYEV